MLKCRAMATKFPLILNVFASIVFLKATSYSSEITISFREGLLISCSKHKQFLKNVLMLPPLNNP